MTDLIAFITARLDEDEQWALAASAPYRYAVEGATVPPGGVHWTWVTGDNWNPIPVDPVGEEYVGESGDGGHVNLASVEEWPGRPWTLEDGSKVPSGMMRATVANSMTEVQSAPAGHIARHDPARVLREVAAKRRTLAALDQRRHFLDNTEWYGCRAIDGDDRPTGAACSCGRDDEVLKQQRLLAEVFADHPDYRQEWAP